MIFDWKLFDSEIGKMYRQVDKFGNAYGCKDTPEAEGLRRQLKEFREQFKAWAKNKEPLPEGNHADKSTAET